MGYNKLHYRTEFQGLPISVENRKGSKRRWYDPHNKEEGSTLMKFPYGYVQGTLGTDGDEVDVYIGPNKKSEKVFVITQNKAPEFVRIDEQKVMLGFNSSQQAKLAFLAHYDKKGFFRSIKELTMEEFKAKLASHKGKLIKGVLITGTEPDKIGESNLFTEDRLRSRTALEIQRMNKDERMTTAAEAFDEVNKALTARIASGVANRARMQARMEAYESVQAHFAAKPVEVPEKVGAGESQPMLGTGRERNEGEPPVVPVRSIHNAVTGPTEDASVYKSCTGCGRMCKSICHTCSNRPSNEATPIWRR